MRIGEVGLITETEPLSIISGGPPSASDFLSRYTLEEELRVLLRQEASRPKVETHGREDATTGFLGILSTGGLTSKCWRGKIECVHGDCRR